jgi:NADH-quinone oxidoreductase chain G
MISIKINDFEFLVKPNISILEACKYAGINVPRFCYHETLSVSGNCRMCLVEIEHLEKPIASCVTEAEEGMSIWVDTPFVKKARENVVEALLLNHPLDCPICDQAGECDLQDQTKTFGSSYSRFFFEKRGVEDKYCGPLIKTIMTRCITCTRCVRYASEVAGVEFFGTFNRGSGTEIGAYVAKMFESEISGNVIDLCPVGALTSKPYAFKARPWELRLSESVDVTDSLGSNIYVNYKETEIFRVLPKSNNDINSSIISDKARFSYDANNNNRINSIYSSFVNNSYQKISWIKFFEDVDKIMVQDKTNFIIDEKCDLETGLLLKKLANKHSDRVEVSVMTKTNSMGNLHLANNNNLMHKIDSTEDLFLILGNNLRLESAVLNSRIRFRYKNSLVNIQAMGINFDENMPINFVNLNLSKAIKVLEGKAPIFSKILLDARKPFIIIGENFADRVSNVNSFIRTISNILPSSNIVYLSNTSNSAGIANLNINKISSNNNSSLIAVNLEDSNLTRKLFSQATKSKKIWINTHGSHLATKFDMIVPSLTSFETEQIYVNVENQPQKTQKSFSSFFNVKSVKNIVLSIFNLDSKAFFSSEESHLSHINEMLRDGEKYNLLKNSVSPFSSISNNFSKYMNVSQISKYPLKQKIKDFYCTDTFTKNSITMQECSSEVIKNSLNFYKS